MSRNTTVRDVTVEELRDHLDAILDAVEHGESISIQRDGRNIAALRPPAELHHGSPYPFRDLEITPLEKALPVDPVRLLVEDRDRERSGEKYGQ